MSRRPIQLVRCLVAIALLVAGLADSSLAKSYSSGGRSYSSHSSSSHSSSFGGSHSFSSSSHTYSSGSSHSSSSGASHSFSSGGGSGSTHTYSSGSHSFGSGSSGSSSSAGSEPKSYRSGTGKSYSAGSTWSDSGRHSYSSGKSYSSGFGRLFSSGSGTDSASTPTSSGMSFDSAAARARREQASQETFKQYKQSQVSSPKAQDFGASRSEPAPAGASSYRVTPPPIPASSRSYRTTYIPDTQVLTTRPVRIYHVFNPYWTRPVVVYRDPYSSLFWWWLLDRSLDDQAWWAYHHRYDMDPLRYQALLDHDHQLEARVADLEAQQAPRDPNYSPAGLDRDLMYSDQHIARVYSNRPTALGTIAFWTLGIPLALAFTAFFIWLIWFKRWQTAT